MEKTVAPKVSIIIPCYNSQKWIADAIGSVKKQRYQDWECIIVNDCSTDNPLPTIYAAIQGDSRFQVLSLPQNGGLSNARNQGIKIAQGTYIMPLDADDMIGEEFLEAAVTFMDDNPECPCVYGRSMKFLDGGNKQWPGGFQRFPGFLSLLYNNCHNVAAMFRKTDCDAIGGYSVNMPAYEDWDFWIKLYDHANRPPHGIDMTSFYYRQRSGSLCRWADERRKIMIEKLKYNNREIYNKHRPMNTTTETVWVMIPYFKGPSQGRELEFCIAGWRHFFKEPYKIALVGDYHPIVETGDDIEWIECPRINPNDFPGQYAPHIDHIHKMMKFMETHPEVQGFIRTSDDEYAINDFDLALVRILKLNNLQMEHKPTYGAWEADEAKTFDKLKLEGLPTRGWVTHIPIYYEKKKLEYLIDHFDLTHESYVLEDLYFNTFYPARTALLLNIKTDNIRCGVWRPDPDYGVIQDALSTKTWINNNIAGYTPEFEKFMSNYYGI